MKSSVLWWSSVGAALLLMFAGLFVSPLRGAEFVPDPAAPAVQHAVSWTATDGSVEVFLVPKAPTKENPTNFRLVVVSTAEIQVAYHTRRNSMEKVEQKLAPVASTLRDVKVYEFSHAFSRTTIWMALEFSKDGKTLDAMTRTFYGGIDQVVPNAKFLDRQ